MEPKKKKKKPILWSCIYIYIHTHMCTYILNSVCVYLSSLRWCRRGGKIVGVVFCECVFLFGLGCESRAELKRCLDWGVCVLICKHCE